MPKHEITVNVTANDIKYGKRNKGQSCPIHRALNRHKVVREQGRFYVGSYYIKHLPPDAEASWDSDYYLGALPELATRFIARFDNGLNVRPFTFEIEIEVPDNAS